MKLALSTTDLGRLLSKQPYPAFYLDGISRVIQKNTFNDMSGQELSRKIHLTTWLAKSGQ
jgi:hypothetical protein